MPERRPVTDGLVIIDKPPSWTSHDVVARMRKLAGTRRVGHAGTLDPMATGVLVVGVGLATRVLHYLVGTDKAYDATIRLGQTTITDDAAGELVAAVSAAATEEDAVRAALAHLTGEIEQVPSAVSAIKVDGQRAYKRVRDGEEVTLAARPITVSRFDAHRFARPEPDLLDIEVTVECSSGTYVRALARDLGGALGVGGHLTALRRTRVGPFGVDQARTLEELAALSDPVTLPMTQALQAAFPIRKLNDDEARELSFGRALSSSGHSGVCAAIGPNGEAVALLQDDNDRARPTAVFTPAG